MMNNVLRCCIGLVFCLGHVSVAQDNQGNSRGLHLPFDTDQTWYVCQGYNGPVSHHDNYTDPVRDFSFSLDFTLTPDVAPGLGACGAGTDTGVEGNVVYAPGDGVIESVRGHSGDDAVCLTLDTGGSLWIGHFTPEVERLDRVYAFQRLGVLNGPDDDNNNFAHIHISAYTSEDCIDGNVPLENTEDYTFKFYGVPDLPDRDGTDNQYDGMMISSSAISHHPQVDGNKDAGHNPLVNCEASNAHAENYFGFCGDGSAIVSGFYFRDIPLEPDAHVGSAHLVFAVDGPGHTPLELDIKAHKDVVTYPFTNVMPHEYSSLTDTSAIWDIPGTQAWHLGQTWESPNINRVVQEAVDDINWVYERPITFIVNTLGELGGEGDELGRSRRVIGSERVDAYIPDTNFQLNHLRPARFVVTTLENQYPVAVAEAKVRLAWSWRDRESNRKRILLSASRSYDPDGSIEDYLWERATGAPLIIRRPKTRFARVIVPADYPDDEVTFKLTVTDDLGSKDSELVVVCLNLEDSCDG